MASELLIQATQFLSRILSGPLVDEGLCRESLGAGPRDPAAAQLYLQIPVRSRPKVSFYFDSAFYLAGNPDVAAAGVDPFVHFIQYGCAEGRCPHPLVDLPFMRSIDPYLFSESPSPVHLRDILESNLLDPSPYFSIEYYRSQTGASAQETSLLAHFL